MLEIHRLFLILIPLKRDIKRFKVLGFLKTKELLKVRLGTKQKLRAMACHTENPDMVPRTHARQQLTTT